MCSKRKVYCAEKISLDIKLFLLNCISVNRAGDKIDTMWTVNSVCSECLAYSFAALESM